MQNSTARRDRQPWPQPEVENSVGRPRSAEVILLKQTSKSRNSKSIQPTWWSRRTGIACWLGCLLLVLSGCENWNPITPTITKSAGDNPTESDSETRIESERISSSASSSTTGLPPGADAYSSSPYNSNGLTGSLSSEKPGTVGASGTPPDSGFDGAQSFGTTNDNATFGSANSGTSLGPAGNHGVDTIMVKNPMLALKEHENGVTTGFSIDYEFSQSGRPNRGSTYVLEITASGGLDIKLYLDEVHRKGNMIGLAPGWKPSFGPFTGVIKEVHANGQVDEVSKTIRFPEKPISIDDL